MPEPITFAEHAHEIIAHAVSLDDQGKKFALITSVAISGGAARHLGSLAVVDEDGQMTGYLSNGCIDRDIQLQASDALRLGEKKLVLYGDGSKFADLSLPCGGSLSVLIDPAPERDAIHQAHASFLDRKHASLAFARPSAEGGLPEEIQFTYAPPFRLVLAGRGAIFRAVAQVGQATGFEVFCLSPDVDDLEAVSQFCHAPPQHLTSPSQEVAFDMLDDDAAFLTLFHDHDWEPELLLSAFKRPAHYLGSLGSLKTQAMRLERLRALGAAQADLDRLHGPIGLVPSLRDAQLIAVSSIAEITSILPPSIRKY